MGIIRKLTLFFFISLLLTPKIKIHCRSQKLYTGIVEGFYGKPWSHRDRINVIKFLNKNSFNLYIYGPKDDIYHRKKWRQKYPNNKLKKIIRLIKTALNNKINFCFAVSPGLSIKYHSQREFNLLLKKYLTMYKYGVRLFALFLDDIPKKLIYKEDIRKFKTLSNAHSFLVNKLYKKLKKINTNNELIFVPTIYHGLKRHPYLVSIGRKINKNIPICWTGPKIVSPKITERHLKIITEILKRKIFLWDNYPVNDFNTASLYIGPIQNRNFNFKKYISYYAANPMNQAAASQIPLITVSKWLEKSENYNPIKAWNYAVNVLFKNKAQDLKIFLKLLLKSRLNPYYKSNLHKKIEKFITGKIEGKTLFKPLHRVLKSIIKIHTINNGKFQADIKPWLIKTRYLINASILSLKLYKNLDNHKLYKKIKHLKIKYSGIAKYIDDFGFEKLISHIRIHYLKSLHKNTVIETNFKSMYPVNFINDRDLNTYYLSKNKVKKGNFIKITFPHEIYVKKIKIYTSAKGKFYYYIRNAFLEISKNSKTFKILKIIKGRTIFINLKKRIKIKSLRLRFFKKSNYPVAIREIVLK